MKSIKRKLMLSILIGGIIMTNTACSKAAENSSANNSEKASTTVTTAQTTTAPVTTTFSKSPEEYGKIVALTFDDGPSVATTDMVLDKLEQYGVKASFFLIGDNITDTTADIVKREFEMGCEVNNHSKTHSDMTQMTADEIKAEISYTSDKIKELTGVEPKFFRPPYIAVNDDLFKAVDLTFISGYGANDWIDSVTAQKRYEMVMKKVRDGSIILLHDAVGNQQTVDALDLIIPDLLEQGYEFVTVSELFYAKGIELNPDTDIVYSYAEQTSMYG